MASGELFYTMDILNNLFDMIMHFLSYMVQPVDNNSFYPIIVLLVLMLLSIALFMMIFRK